MSVRYDCKCEGCGTKVGEATFPYPIPDEWRIAKCESGMLCESCADKINAEQEANHE